MLYPESLTCRVVLNAVVNKYEPIVLLNELVNNKDGKVLFMFDMDVIVELTVDDKFETVVIIEYDDKFDIKVELDIKDGIVALMFAIPVVRLPNEVVWLSNCEYVVN